MMEYLVGSLVTLAALSALVSLWYASVRVKLTTKLEVAKHEISRLRAAPPTPPEDTQAYRERILELEERVNDLLAQLDSLLQTPGKLDEANAEVAALRDRITKLILDHEGQRVALGELNNEADCLRMTVSQQSAEIVTLEGGLDEANKSLGVATAEATGMSCQLRDARRDLAQIEQNLRASEIRASALGESERVARAENETLRASLEEATLSLEKHRTALIDARVEVAVAQTKADSAVAATAALREVNDKLVSSADQGTRPFVRLLDESRVEIGELRAQLAEGQGLLAAERVRVAETTAAVDKLKAALSGTEDRLTSSEAELARLKETTTLDSDALHRSNQLTLADLTTAREALAEKTSDNLAISRELEAVKQRRDELVTSLATHDERAEVLRRRLQDATVSLEDRDAIISQLRSQNTGNAEQAETRWAEIAKLTELLAEANEAVAKSQAELEGAQREAAGLARVVQSREGELEAAQATLERTQKKALDHATEAKEATDALDSERSQFRAEMDQRVTELQRALGELSCTRSRVLELEPMVERLSEELHAENAKVSELTARLEALPKDERGVVEKVLSQELEVERLRGELSAANADRDRATENYRAGRELLLSTQGIVERAEATAEAARAEFERLAAGDKAHIEQLYDQLRQRDTELETRATESGELRVEITKLTGAVAYQEYLAKQAEGRLSELSKGTTEITTAQIREVLLSNGFSLEGGVADLKPYVYNASVALLRIAGVEAIGPVPVYSNIPTLSTGESPAPEVLEVAPTPTEAVIPSEVAPQSPSSLGDRLKRVLSTGGAPDTPGAREHVSLEDAIERAEVVANLLVTTKPETTPLETLVSTVYELKQPSPNELWRDPVTGERYVAEFILNKDGKNHQGGSRPVIVAYRVWDGKRALDPRKLELFGCTLQDWCENFEFYSKTK